MSNDPQKSLGQQPSLVGRVDGSDIDTHDKSLSDAVTHVRRISQVGQSHSLQNIVELADRYQLERTLGRGGMGQVDLATDRRLGRKVAIKRIHEKTVASSTSIERFLAEARAIAALAGFIVCQRKPNGSTLAGRAARRRTPLGTMNLNSENTLGTIRTQMKELMRWVKRNLMLGGYLICMAMCGNGAQIGMETTRKVM